jgi:hypothetical protein
MLAWQDGDGARAAALLGQGLAQARGTGDEGLAARCLGGLGQLALHGGDPAAAAVPGAEALSLARRAGDRWGQTFALMTLGTAAVAQRDEARAATLLEEALALACAGGDTLQALIARYYLGGLALLRGEPAAARATLEAGLADACGTRSFMSSHLPEMLGRARLAQGDHAGACEFLCASVALLREEGATACLAHTLEGFARLALAPTADPAGPARAARLLGAAQALCDALGSPLMPIEQALYERTVAAARASLGTAAFAAAWAEGRALPLEQAIAAALAARGIATAG